MLKHIYYRLISQILIKLSKNVSKIQPKIRNLVHLVLASFGV